MEVAPLVASLLAATGILALAGALRSLSAASPIDSLVQDPRRGITVFPRWRAPARGIGFPIPVLTARRAARRRTAYDAEIPQLLDLLAAGSSAGLAAPLALRRAAESLRGPLGRELVSSFEAVDLGARWRDELASLADRLDLPDLRRTVAVLVRTEVLGSSLVVATRQLADDVRRARRAAMTEKARAAPVKMLFPLVFLVLPAFLLLTVVPVLLTTLRSIG